MDQVNVISLINVLGDPQRFKIVSLLEKGPLCACELLASLAITQPTLSHHMRILEQAKIVQVRKVGTWNHYSLDADSFILLANYFSQISKTIHTAPLSHLEKGNRCIKPNKSSD